MQRKMRRAQKNNKILRSNFRKNHKCAPPLTSYSLVHLGLLYSKANIRIIQLQKITFNLNFDHSAYSKACFIDIFVKSFICENHNVERSRLILSKIRQWRFSCVPWFLNMAPKFTKQKKLLWSQKSLVAYLIDAIKKGPLKR